MLGLSFLSGLYAVRKCFTSCRRSFFPQQPLLLTTPVDFVSYLVLNFHRYTTAPSPKLPTPLPAPPRRRHSSSRSRCCCCCYWCPLRMFLKIKNRLSVVTTSPSQCQYVCSSCRTAAARDTTTAAVPILAGLSLASAPAAAAAATAAVCCCWWCCSLSCTRS